MRDTERGENNRTSLGIETEKTFINKYLSFIFNIVV